MGSKIDTKRKSNGLSDVKFTQPVLVQKLYLESMEGKAPKIPAVAGQILVKGDGSDTMEDSEDTVYRSVTARCMYIIQWSMTDIYNATSGQGRHMPAPREAHGKALQTLMRCVVVTKKRRLVLSPDTLWDGSKKLKFKIHGGFGFC